MAPKRASEKRGYIPPVVRRMLAERSQGRCEGCGKVTRLEAHHRQYTSRGGLSVIENLLHLCGWGNHTGCHGKAHSAKPPEGWALPSGKGIDPADEEFVDLRGYRYRLNDDGTKERV